MHTLAEMGGWIVVGALLGFVYFGGLWLTVRSLPQRRRPGHAMLQSFLIRIGLLIWAIYGLTGGAPGAVLALMAGFLATRTTWTRAIVWRSESWT